MAEKINLGWLKTNEGEKFAPKTLASQVQTSDGTLIEDKFQSEINTLRDEVDARINEAVGDIDLSDIQTQLDNKVPNTRTVNGKALSSNIALSASDVDAYTKAETDALIGDIDLSDIQTQLDGKADNADVGFSRIVTCTSSDGVAYTGTTNGVTTLTAGLTLIFISSKTSASTTPTLNINGLGAKSIKRRLSHLSTTTQAGYSTTWLYANKPYFLVYDGTQWIVDGLTKPSAADLYGTLPVEKGGTGATTAEAARTNLEAAPAYTYGTEDLTAGTSPLETGRLYFVYE